VIEEALVWLVSASHGAGDGARIRRVQLGKLYDTLISTIYSPLVLIREYQALWSFWAPGGWSYKWNANGMQGCLFETNFSRIAAVQPVNLHDLWCRHRNILTRLTHEPSDLPLLCLTGECVSSRWAAQFDSMGGNPLHTTLLQIAFEDVCLDPKEPISNGGR
jgi:hypothetical protein